jgi:hypothetical protein
VTAPTTVVAPGPIKVKVVVLRVAGFIAWLKVAVIIAVLGQVMAEPFGGVTAVTVGGGQAAEAVKDQKKLVASPLPYRS